MVATVLLAGATSASPAPVADLGRVRDQVMALLEEIAARAQVSSATLRWADPGPALLADLAELEEKARLARALYGAHLGAPLVDQDRGRARGGSPDSVPSSLDEADLPPLIGAPDSGAQAWLAEHFERTWPWLRAALAQQPLKTHTREDIWAALVEGHAQLWPTINSVCLTEIKHFPSGLKSLNGWLAGGDMCEVLQTVASLERYARKIGCDAATIHGRRGWLRALDGYQDAGTSMTKDLSR